MKLETEDRKCILTGIVKDKSELLRFTLLPGGLIVPDFKRKLPGRGIYVSNSKKLLKQTLDKHLFAKVTKGKAKDDISLLGMVEDLLKKKGLETLNLARKAGAFVSGFDKVKDALLKNNVSFLLEAKDAAFDGHEKILALAKDIVFFDLYTTEELDKALYKANTVHAAFLKNEMSLAAYKELKRYEQFLNS